MIRDRVIELFKEIGYTSKAMEKATGIDRDKWGSIRARRRRVNEEDLEALFEAFPQYAYWLATGQTIAEAGQISPDIDKTRKENNLKHG